MASSMLDELIECSVSLRSFREAAYYAHQRAEEELSVRICSAVMKLTRFALSMSPLKSCGEIAFLYYCKAHTLSQAQSAG